MQFFQWVIVAIIGALVGTLAGYVGGALRVPASLTIAIGVVGALVGGGLTLVTNFDAFGMATFYAAGLLVSIGVVAGGLLAFTLTSGENRV